MGVHVVPALPNDKGKSDRVVAWASRHLLPVAPLLFLLHKALRRLKVKGVAARGLTPSLVAGILLLFFRSFKTLGRQLLGRGRVAPDIPGRLPVIGHLWTLFKMQPKMFDFFAEFYPKVGQTLRVVIGPECAPAKVLTFTTDPANVEHFLKTNFENYGKGQEIQDIMKHFLGQGIFAADGDIWKHQRKVAATIFNRRNFSDHMVHVFQAHARRLVSVMKARAQQGPEQPESDMQELFFALTLDAFCEIGFGLDWNTMEDDQPGVTERRLFATHFDRAQAVMTTRFWLRPWWKMERALARLGLLPSSSEEVQVEESLSYMDTMVDDILTRRLAEQREMVQDRDRTKSDLLSLFVRETSDKKYLRDIVINFIIAGRDTTACTLSWMFWRLATSPEVLFRVREEVARVAAEEPPSDGEEPTFSFSALGKMTFCHAVVRETVRLHPSVPMNTKVAFGDDMLPDGTLVEKGDFLCYDPYGTARSKCHWGEDAAEWKPDRWLTMEKEPSVFLNCAFQAGPRICLGREMAVLEIKAVLAQVIHSKLEWKVRPNFEPTYRFPSIVLAMNQPGLPVTVQLPEP